MAGHIIYINHGSRGTGKYWNILEYTGRNFSTWKYLNILECLLYILEFFCYCTSRHILWYIAIYCNYNCVDCKLLQFNLRHWEKLQDNLQCKLQLLAINFKYMSFTCFPDSLFRLYFCAFDIVFFGFNLVFYSVLLCIITISVKKINTFR